MVSGLTAKIDDAEVLLELADEASDEVAHKEAIEELGEVTGELDALELESLYYDEYDEGDAILSVHAGAGGVDAQDWAEMLARMYQRFLADSSFTYTVEEVTEGEEAGIKSATFTVKGDRAYGTLESERGVHRLVRISPFDSQARRHTSFAGVVVVPDLGDQAKLEIDEDDLRIDTYRSQGAGGQHVNTTDSAVRITHLPPGSSCNARTNGPSCRTRHGRWPFSSPVSPSGPARSGRPTSKSSEEISRRPPGVDRSAPTSCSLTKWSKICAPNMK